jgi:hypothetical protein
VSVETIHTAFAGREVREAMEPPTRPPAQPPNRLTVKPPNRSTETGCLGETVGQQYIPEYLDVLDLWMMER